MSVHAFPPDLVLPPLALPSFSETRLLLDPESPLAASAGFSAGKKTSPRNLAFLRFDPDVSPRVAPLLPDDPPTLSPFLTKRWPFF